jgi:phage tail-like protein
MTDPSIDGVLSVYFSLVIDNVDLGSFSTCDGLSIDMQVTTREDGGGGATVYQLPGRFKYSNLHVTRPIGPETAKTMRWLQTMLKGMKPSTASLSALSPSGQIVFSWTLTGVVPAKWTGPSFDVGNPTPAHETLELAYTSIMLGDAQ